MRFPRARLLLLCGTARSVAVTMSHRRQLPPSPGVLVETRHMDGAVLFEDAGSRRVMFAIRGAGGHLHWEGVRDYQKEMKRVSATIVETWLRVARVNGLSSFHRRWRMPRAPGGSPNSITAPRAQPR